MSGKTTNEIMKKLRERSAEQYEAVLAKTVRQQSRRVDMSAAFRDGMSTMLQHLVGMGVIEIIEDPRAR